ncbi:NAD(P)/FAD-dependent oxidoreductase [Oceanibium sediminis]|uniref:NAD(P)/FAD-dependent oxidoreductase n=1 Tax=Oceanibium sediminis TaxID=2026339 RepID=UPI000DD30AD8|nr:FAD-dependent oxidoreductase [Oceanibium sediminis]
MKIAVIGAGLIGAGAARHLTGMGHEVALIGPDEPAKKRTHAGVFASHYDEGRITRILATDAFWSDVSRASIARYGAIASAGGIGFYTNCGAMMAGPAGHPFTEGAARVRQQRAVPSEELEGALLAARFPCFAFPGGTRAFHETTGGHISPRRLVAAQIAAATRAGAVRIREVVSSVTPAAAQVTITTPSASHTADRVLIATGAMTDHIAPRPPGQRVYARTVALFEVDEPEAARLAGMPSLVFRGEGAAEPYLLPPIRYPDGKLYLKLGGDPVDVQLHTPEEIGDWFRSSGNGDVRDHLEAQIRTLMPDLAIRATKMDACVTTFTATGRPVIDWADERIALATGGNGAGAKCSDELGRLAATLISGGADPLLHQTTWT